MSVSHLQWIMQDRVTHGFKYRGVATVRERERGERQKVTSPSSERERGRHTLAQVDS